jgi:hypothetical protein
MTALGVVYPQYRDADLIATKETFFPHLNTLKVAFVTLVRLVDWTMTLFHSFSSHA